MPAINHQQSGGSCPEIISAEIYIPDDSDLGTGSFSTTFSPRAFTAKKDVTSAMVNRPSFMIAATVTQTGEVHVGIGKTEAGTDITFILPAESRRDRKAHSLSVAFEKWRIVAASIDGEPLRVKRTETEH